AGVGEQDPLWSGELGHRRGRVADPPLLDALGDSPGAADELAGRGMGALEQLLTGARTIPARLTKDASVLRTDHDQRVEGEPLAPVADPLERRAEARAQLLGRPGQLI